MEHPSTSRHKQNNPWIPPTPGPNNSGYYFPGQSFPPPAGGVSGLPPSFFEQPQSDHANHVLLYQQQNICAHMQTPNPLQHQSQLAMTQQAMMQPSPQHRPFCLPQYADLPNSHFPLVNVGHPNSSSNPPPLVYAGECSGSPTIPHVINHPRRSSLALNHPPIMEPPVSRTQQMLTSWAVPTMPNTEGVQSPHPMPNVFQSSMNPRPLRLEPTTNHFGSSAGQSVVSGIEAYPRLASAESGTELLDLLSADSLVPLFNISSVLRTRDSSTSTSVTSSVTSTEPIVVNDNLRSKVTSTSNRTRNIRPKPAMSSNSEPRCATMPPLSQFNSSNVTGRTRDQTLQVAHHSHSRFQDKTLQVHHRRSVSQDQRLPATHQTKLPCQNSISQDQRLPATRQDPNLPAVHQRNSISQDQRLPATRQDPNLPATHQDPNLPVVRHQNSIPQDRRLPATRQDPKLPVIHHHPNICASSVSTATGPQVQTNLLPTFSLVDNISASTSASSNSSMAPLTENRSSNKDPFSTLLLRDLIATFCSSSQVIPFANQPVVSQENELSRESSLAMATRSVDSVNYVSSDDENGLEIDETVNLSSPLATSLSVMSSCPDPPTNMVNDDTDSVEILQVCPPRTTVPLSSSDSPVNGLAANDIPSSSSIDVPVPVPSSSGDVPLPVPSIVNVPVPVPNSTDADVLVSTSIPSIISPSANTLVSTSTSAPVLVSCSTDINSANLHNSFGEKVNEMLPFAHFFDLECVKSSESLSQAVVSTPGALSIPIPVPSSAPMAMPSSSSTATSAMHAEAVPSARHGQSMHMKLVENSPTSTKVTMMDSKSLYSGLVDFARSECVSDLIASVVAGANEVPAGNVGSTGVDSSENQVIYVDHSDQEDMVLENAGGKEDENIHLKRVRNNSFKEDDKTLIEKMRISHVDVDSNEDDETDQVICSKHWLLK